MGRHEQVVIEAPQASVEEASVDGKSQAAAEEEAEVKTEERWIQYKFDQTKEELVQVYASEKGLLRIDGISYVFDPEGLKSGTYELIIKDVTQGIPDEKHLETMRLDLKLFSSEQEAELAAAQAAAGGGKGKKK